VGIDKTASQHNVSVAGMSLAEPLAPLTQLWLGGSPGNQPLAMALQTLTGELAFVIVPTSANSPTGGGFIAQVALGSPGLQLMNSYPLPNNNSGNDPYYRIVGAGSPYAGAAAGGLVIASSSASNLQFLSSFSPETGAVSAAYPLSTQYSKSAAAVDTATGCVQLSLGSAAVVYQYCVPGAPTAAPRPSWSASPTPSSMSTPTATESTGGTLSSTATATATASPFPTIPPMPSESPTGSPSPSASVSSPSRSHEPPAGAPPGGSVSKGVAAGSAAGAFAAGVLAAAGLVFCFVRHRYLRSGNSGSRGGAGGVGGGGGYRPPEPSAPPAADVRAHRRLVGAGGSGASEGSSNGALSATQPLFRVRPLASGGREFCAPVAPPGVVVSHDAGTAQERQPLMASAHRVEEQQDPQGHADEGSGGFLRR
jgi:hypothetical protein